MTTLMYIGTTLGLIVGLIHAGYVYMKKTGESPANLAAHPVSVRANAAYFALWTLGLWVLFGSYVFNFWVTALVVFAIYQALKRIPRLVTRR
ncbi:MAG: hypothetical protein ACE5Q6_24570 [Dehalococcoidia bacterium]